jgi:hypothetical protein
MAQRDLYRTIPTTPTGGGGGGGGGTNRPPTPTSTSGSGSSYDPRAAEARAVARANADKRKAGQRYLKQAGNLEHQAKALRRALTQEFAKNRDTNLGNVQQRLTENLGILKDDAKKRGGILDEAATNTEVATGQQENQTLTNAVRERADAMSMLMEQGMGETDQMRAMLMAARNMNANQNEGNRSYFDSMQSINSSITDLNADTRTALANTFGEAEAERGRIWENYYSKRNQGFTQLGNIRGQQADAYANAREMGVSPGAGKEKAAQAGMKGNYEAAATEAGKAYKEKALPDWMKNWEGTARRNAQVQNTNLASAITIDKAEKAEGASLRRWEG